jgi:hypothetical protein
MPKPTEAEQLQATRRAALMAQESIALADGPAVVAAFGVDGLMQMIGQYGIHPDVCAANAAYMGNDAEKFCSLLRKGAEAIGFNVQAGRDDTGRLRIACGDIDMSDGSYMVLANGDVEKWIPLADAGEDWINGGRKFDITPELVKQGIANFEASGKAPLPVTYGHLEDSAAPARAWINDIQLRDDGLPWGKVLFLKDTWAAIERGEYKFFSLEFYPVDVNRKGEEIGFRFDGGAILNKPFFNIRVDQGRPPSFFRLSRFGAAAPKPSPVTNSSSTNNAGGGNARGTGDPTMTTPATTAAGAAPAGGAAGTTPGVTLEQVRISGDSVTLSRQQFDTLMQSQRETERLRGDLATAQGANETNERRIGQLERQGTASKIRNAIGRLRAGSVIVQLGDYAIDTSDSDCIEWLASAPFGITSVEGLEKLARDHEQYAHLPRIKLGGEKASGSTTHPEADVTTKAGRDEAVRQAVQRLRRDTPKHELEPMLARRHQTAEELARHLLAADHPEYRKEILAGN